VWAKPEEGTFHPSPPITGNRIQILILDVARYKYPPSWVNTTELWNAMDMIDSDSGKKRGYLMVRNLAL